MTRLALLSGGVGGARLARGLAALPNHDLTVIVNVGDDERIYGLWVSPDLDTVAYTLAGIEGPEGWGVSGDTFDVMGRLESFGADTPFKIGDVDLATNLFRTVQRGAGLPLSLITERICKSLGMTAAVIPATDDEVRTMIQIEGGTWLGFQEYFVHRGHRDEVADVRFEGAETAAPAPGVTEAITQADTVLIGPSNPPLSIWPILAVAGIADALSRAERVIAVSPLFRGKAIKGPADRVLASLGFSPGNAGVLEAYDGLITDLVVDSGDASDRAKLSDHGARLHVADARMSEAADSERFAIWLETIL